MSRTITVDAWLRELARLQNDGDTEWQTAAELEQVLGVTNRVMLRILNRARAAGRLQTTKVWRANIAGDQMRIPAYKILAPTEQNNEAKQTHLFS